MQAEKLKIDGMELSVFITYPSRLLDFEIVEGPNSFTTLSFRDVVDVGGTKYRYSMRVRPNPEFPEDFDMLFDIVSAPVESHVVTLPFAQREISFDARIKSGSVVDYGSDGEHRTWSDLEIVFVPIKPQRTPGGAWG